MMKHRKRLPLILLAALVATGLVVAVAMGLTIPLPAKAATATTADTAPRLNVRKKTLSYWETYQLKVKGTDATATWSSSNPKVARVSKNGKVRAVATMDATAVITATVAGQQLDCKIVVRANTEQSVRNFAEKEYAAIWKAAKAGEYRKGSKIVNVGQSEYVEGDPWYARGIYFFRGEKYSIVIEAFGNYSVHFQEYDSLYRYNITDKKGKIVAKHEKLSSKLDKLIVDIEKYANNG